MSHITTITHHLPYMTLITHHHSTMSHFTIAHFTNHHSTLHSSPQHTSLITTANVTNHHSTLHSSPQQMSLITTYHHRHTTHTHHTFLYTTKLNWLYNFVSMATSRLGWTLPSRYSTGTTQPPSDCSYGISLVGDISLQSPVAPLVSQNLVSDKIKKSVLIRVNLSCNYESLIEPKVLSSI